MILTWESRKRKCWTRRLTFPRLWTASFMSTTLRNRNRPKVAPTTNLTGRRSQWRFCPFRNELCYVQKHRRSNRIPNQHHSVILPRHHVSLVDGHRKRFSGCWKCISGCCYRPPGLSVRRSSDRTPQPFTSSSICPHKLIQCRWWPTKLCCGKSRYISIAKIKDWVIRPI